MKPVVYFQGCPPHHPPFPQNLPTVPSRAPAASTCLLHPKFRGPADSLPLEGDKPVPHAAQDVRDVRHVHEHRDKARHAGVYLGGSLLLPCHFLYRVKRPIHVSEPDMSGASSASDVIDTSSGTDRSMSKRRRREMCESKRSRSPHYTDSQWPK